jgi:hypothetical protein
METISTVKRRGRPAGGTNKPRVHTPTDTSLSHVRYNTDYTADADGYVRRKIYKGTTLSSTWVYDPKKSLTNPVWVENHDVVDSDYKEDTAGNNMMANKDLPKSKRTYLNPANGKYVGYTRARMLGLVK